MDVHTVAKALLVLLAGYVVKFLTTFYKKRHALNGLVRYMGPAPERCTDSLQPQPPFSFAFGHLLIISKLVSTLPANCHPHVLTYYIRKKYDLPPIFYMEMWPFSYSICAVLDPDVAYQITVQRSLPKHQASSNVIWPLAGTKNLVVMDGPEHKRWRAIFNPGFSSAHLMTLVDGIVDDSLTFMDVLAEHAEAKDIFSLEEAATRATVDIIGRVAL